jgi:hypothetical protein
MMWGVNMVAQRTLQSLLMRRLPRCLPQCTCRLNLVNDAKPSVTVRQSWQEVECYPGELARTSDVG